MKHILINTHVIASLVMSALFLSSPIQAQQNEVDKQASAEPADRVELTTSFIKGNKELPQVLYIVPWQEVKKITKKPENMVLHSLYGDIFQPITTADLTGD